MTTDDGGWTLFLTYRHHPYELTNIQTLDTLPIDQYHQQQHVQLQDIGVSPLEVKQIRFFCLTSHKDDKGAMSFVHFKTSNKQVIQTAFDGNQLNMDHKAFMSDEGQLPEPDKLSNFIQEMKLSSNQVFHRAPISKKAQIVGQNPQGGLWDTPFSNIDSRWTIKGPKQNVVVYECGDVIPDQLRNGADYDTLHQAWYRTIQMSQTKLEARQIRIIKALAKAQGQPSTSSQDQQEICTS